MTQQPVFDLGPALALVLAALNIVNILYTWWRTRDQNVEARFRLGSERMDRADVRVNAIDARVSSLEQALRNLPAKEDLHNLSLAVAELRGDFREIRASLAATADAMNRQDTVTRRLEQFLLERSAK